MTELWKSKWCLYQHLLQDRTGCKETALLIQGSGRSPKHEKTEQSSKLKHWASNLPVQWSSRRVTKQHSLDAVEFEACTAKQRHSYWLAKEWRATQVKMLCLLPVLKQENRKQNHKNCTHCRDKHNVSERETSSTRAKNIKVTKILRKCVTTYYNKSAPKELCF